MPLAQTVVEAPTPSPLARKLGHFVALSPDEADVLEALQGPLRTVRRRQEIVTEGRKYGTVFALLDGIAIRYRIMRDGRRQIISVVLPGDFVGVHGSFFESALYSIKALTDAVVAPVPLADVMGLFDTHPRLAAKLFWSFSCEAALYAEHLVTVGRRTAIERVAHFLLELLLRLQLVGLADHRSFQLPLTQELIGDAVGLSIPHVNRVMKQLRDEGLVSVKERKVVITDVDRLSALADFEMTYLKPLSIAEVIEEP